MSTSIKLPLWLNVLTAAYFLSNLFIFGGLSLFFPHIAFPDAGPTAVFPIEFFAIRHIAFAFPLLYGLTKQDTKILMVCYSMFFVMSTLDVVYLFAKDYYVPVIGQVSMLAKIGLATFGFMGPVSVALVKLNSYEKIV